MVMESMGNIGGYHTSVVHAVRLHTLGSAQPLSTLIRLIINDAIASVHGQWRSSPSAGTAKMASHHTEGEEGEGGMEKDNYGMTYIKSHTLCTWCLEQSDARLPL